jgi:hypothetical protein
VGGQHCKGAWHADCYRQFEKDEFPVLRAWDLENALMGPEEFSVEDKEDKERFKVARPGDHLMTTFQCDQCMFVNLKGRKAGASVKDELVELCIRRAILDSFWSRETSTVEKNRNEMRRFLETADLLGINNPLPKRGPFPIGEDQGLGVACTILIRSLDAGRNAKHVQFETIRKLRSVVSNFIHTTPGGVGFSTISAGEGGGQFFSSSPTNCFWFKRFLVGCHRRMGDVWIPDRAITMPELNGCLNVLEGDWTRESLSKQERLEVALSGVLLTTGFGAALRGEEIPQIEVGGIRKYWNEAVNHEVPHVPLTLIGRFKRTTGEKLYVQPLAVRSDSGISYRKWMERALKMYELAGITSGPMFRSVKRGKVVRSSVGDLNGLFFDILKRLQFRNPEILSPDVKVEDEFSVRRSLRRGSTTQAQNVGVPKEVIEANNRWKKHLHSKGLLPSMSMVERYTDAKANVRYLVKYSGLM